MPNSFLLIGIAWEEMKGIVGEEKAEETTAAVKGMLKKGEQQFIDAGLDYEFMTYSPNESMERLEQKLKEKNWAGVCIGNGIRSTAKFTPLFERLVNTIAETSPNSKILFNTMPDSTLEAVRRWFP